MKLAALITGGKDSLYSAYLAGKENSIEYIILLGADEPNSHIVRQQAAMMGVPLIERKDSSIGELEQALEAVKNEIDGIVFGSVASTSKKMEIDALCKRLGLLPIAPLWHIDAKDYIQNMISDGFEMIFVAARQPLGKEWLGRKLDAQALFDLVKLNKKHGVNVSGEDGEYETFVTDCPMFVRRIDVLWAESSWNGGRGTYD